MGTDKPELLLEEKLPVSIGELTEVIRCAKDQEAKKCSDFKAKTALLLVEISYLISHRGEMGIEREYNQFAAMRSKIEAFLSEF